MGVGCLRNRWRALGKVFAKCNAVFLSHNYVVALHNMTLMHNILTLISKITESVAQLAGIVSTAATSPIPSWVKWSVETRNAELRIKFQVREVINRNSTSVIFISWTFEFIKLLTNQRQQLCLLQQHLFTLSVCLFYRPRRMERWVDVVGWLHRLPVDGLPVRRRSSIQIQTEPNVD